MDKYEGGGEWKIRSEELGEQRYKEENDGALESKIVESDEATCVKQMWEQLKQAVVGSTREVMAL